MKPLSFSIVNCIWKLLIFLEFVASYHTCLNTCLRHKTEGCQPFTSQPWSLSSLSLEREAQLVTSLQSQGLCGVPCGVPCGVCRGSRSTPAHALSSLLPLISIPHPLGWESQNHPWRIRHGRTIYWWRRQPHHQKSNRHWDFMLLEFKCPAWETTLVCDRFIAPPRDHRIVPTSLCCFQQITQKVIRRIGPQGRKQDEVVM